MHAGMIDDAASDAARHLHGEPLLVGERLSRSMAARHASQLVTSGKAVSDTTVGRKSWSSYAWVAAAAEVARHRCGPLCPCCKDL